LPSSRITAGAMSTLDPASIAAPEKRRVKPDVRERFAYAVNLRREELGLTQEDLAYKAGTHRTYLSDVERGTRNLSLVNIERLAAALEIRMSELFAAVEEG
jgi:ribosome-binding protein aMBF1 (putative translation factor)